MAAQPAPFAIRINSMLINAIAGILRRIISAARLTLINGQLFTLGNCHRPTGNNNPWSYPLCASHEYSSFHTIKNRDLVDEPT